MTNTNSLALDTLPELPLTAPLREVAPRLWVRDEVRAIWVGGSLATGKADAYSDVDLFIAVPPDAMAFWREPDLHALFGQRYIASQFSFFGNDFYVHHIFLDSGDIYDLHIQSTESDFRREARLILASRDAALAEALSVPSEVSTLPPLTASRELVQTLVESYWYNTHKHRKALHRKLELMVASSLYIFHAMYLRLVYIDVTGNDSGDLRRQTIHSMSPIMRTLSVHDGAALLAVVGAPTRTREEIIIAIDLLNDAVANVGQRLAARFEFDYPATLESLVRRSWSQFQREEGSR